MIAIRPARARVARLPPPGTAGHVPAPRRCASYGPRRGVRAAVNPPGTLGERLPAPSAHRRASLSALAGVREARVWGPGCADWVGWGGWGGRGLRACAPRRTVERVVIQVGGPGPNSWPAPTAHQDISQAVMAWPPERPAAVASSGPAGGRSLAGCRWRRERCPAARRLGPGPDPGAGTGKGRSVAAGGA